MSSLLSKVSYAESVKPASPRVAKKSFNEVGRTTNEPQLTIKTLRYSTWMKRFLGLFAAAKIVGMTLKVDEATVYVSRLTMARVCVEIDLLKPKIEDFWIGIREVRRLQKNSATMGEDPRGLKEDKHLEGIPKEGAEAHLGDSEEHSFLPIDDFVLGVITTSSEEEEDVGSFDISKSFVEMEDLDLDNLVIKKGRSSLNDESSGGAVRQGPDWDPEIHNMMTRRKTQMIKLRRLKEHLKWWNEDVFDNIHDKVKLEEERYVTVEKKFDADPSVVNTI
ncbi:hypothetical protein ZIOFF_010174 [Zingiber officinale]|uniref:Uncharacterized protein n=1 Tax=Zingiber officinale TaxID=94328 RepID=A0A8J5I3R3_ZINOF|nr:hypothetical protein ZIOFF_010174 [Zingiber officinale]